MVRTDQHGPHRHGPPKPTAENIEAGVVDFRALAGETRKRMQANFEKGRALGKSRSQGGGAKKSGSRSKSR